MCVSLSKNGIRRSPSNHEAFLIAVFEPVQIEEQTRKSKKKIIRPGQTDSTRKVSQIDNAGGSAIRDLACVKKCNRGIHTTSVGYFAR